MSDKMRKNALLVFVALAAALLIAATFMNIKGDMDTRALLEESIKSQLLSITSAANEIIDETVFETYNTVEDIEHNDHYQSQLTRLRVLARNTGASYIYALKMEDGVAQFVFDTDDYSDTYFDTYELDPVFKEAFSGKPAAGIMNVDDEYGSFNSGAEPITYEGRIVGIICADLRDTLVERNLRQSKCNTILTVSVLFALLTLCFFAFRALLNKTKLLHDELERMAHYDRLTDLPNRRFLMDRLLQATNTKTPKPFALFFIDMDNFKAVNDSAGHDAGDELLRHTGAFLKDIHPSTVFRPGSGSLNVTARIGGDEFIMIVPDIATAEAANAFARRVLDGFQSPVIDKYIAQYQVGLSIGCALYPGDSSDAQVLIRYADIAMYEAKKAGKNGFRIYDAEMNKGTHGTCSATSVVTPPR